MESRKSSNDGRQDKRTGRIRLPIQGSSMVSTQSTSDGVTTTTSHQSIRSAISVRLARRESRKVARKTISTSTSGIEGGSRESTQHDESFRAEDEEYDNDDDLHSSHYSLPGAFRVKRKPGSRERIECTLEEGSIESFSTAKTPPVIIPSASLVVQESFQEPIEEELPIAYPEPHVLLVTKRHFCICITLTCLMFGGLFTGLLFALWDRHELSTASENAMDSDQNAMGPAAVPSPVVPSPALSPSLIFGTEFGPLPTIYPSLGSNDITESPTPSPVTYASQSPTATPQFSPTVSSLSLTSTPNGEFSFTSRPTFTPTVVPES